MSNKKQQQESDAEREAKAVARLKAMIAAFHRGEFSIRDLQGKPKNATPVNYDHLSDCTVYASLSPEQEAEDQAEYETELLKSGQSTQTK